MLPGGGLALAGQQAEAGRRVSGVPRALLLAKWSPSCGPRTSPGRWLARVCGVGCAGRGAEYLPGGPSHSCHVLRQGQTWNRGALEQTQHICHAGGQARPGAGEGVSPSGWGVTGSHGRALNIPPASFQTPIPQARTEDRHGKGAVSPSPPLTPGMPWSLTQPGRHACPVPWPAPHPAD